MEKRNGRKDTEDRRGGKDDYCVQFIQETFTVLPDDLAAISLPSAREGK